MKKGFYECMKGPLWCYRGNDQIILLLATGLCFKLWAKDIDTDYQCQNLLQIAHWLDFGGCKLAIDNDQEQYARRCAVVIHWLTLI